MVRDPLERRSDPRTPAHLPIMLRMEGEGEMTPAHLVDLSSGGACLLTTSYNSPEMGQHLDLEFESPTNNDDGGPLETRNETAIVVNIGSPENGIARLGVRFIQRHELGTNIFDPIDVLTDHRRSMPVDVLGHRWDAARNFDLIRKNREKESVGTV